MLDAIHEAAQYVLHGTPSHLLSPPVLVVSITSLSLVHATPEIKTEDLSVVLEHITGSFIKVLAAQHNHAPQNDSLPSCPCSDPSSGCNYCGGPHYICDCKEVDEDVKNGLCKRNTEGCVTLPSGAFVPRDIPGKNIKERTEEWHHCNPRQLTATQMIYNVLSNDISNTPEIS